MSCHSDTRALRKLRGGWRDGRFLVCRLLAIFCWGLSSLAGATTGSRTDCPGGNCHGATLTWDCGSDVLSFIEMTYGSNCGGTTNNYLSTAQACDGTSSCSIFFPTDPCPGIAKEVYSQWTCETLCASGTHNCDPDGAWCAVSGGSFSCNCNDGFEGFGWVCGTRIPPSDIGLGHSLGFTWSKDSSTLFNGKVTFSKTYSNKICNGNYRVYAADKWLDMTGDTSVAANERLPSAAFDGSLDGLAWYGAAAAGTLAASDGDTTIVLETPCALTMAGYTWQARDEGVISLAINYSPYSMTVSGGYYIDGPWTELHSFDGLTSWAGNSDQKTFLADSRPRPFRFFRFLIRRVNHAATTSIVQADNIFLYAAAWYDIGLGHPGAFTWTKDKDWLYSGIVTIFKDYTGNVCPGQYRIYSAGSWWDSPGDTATTVNAGEWPPSSLFDSSLDGNGWSSSEELDECAAGVHNCDPQATCANTNGSFTCTCNAGLDGDGVACGIRVPPADIGRADNVEFTWTKDKDWLFNDVVTIFKNYTGDVCTGEYRVFSPCDWLNNPGKVTTVGTDEYITSSLFDGSLESWPWHPSSSSTAGVDTASESEVHVILRTPCYITMAGYSWQSRTDAYENQNPSAMNVSGANSTDGPWTTLHSYSGVTNWDVGEKKIWPADIRPGPFRFFRFTVRRVQNPTANWASGASAYLYAAAITELDECAAGVHNCDPQATCANTNGSFTCACSAGLLSAPELPSGVVCGLRIPPSEIGRGDSSSFTWTKDAKNLFNGFVTTFKNYTGDLCPGEFRVFTPEDWYQNPGPTETSIAASEWCPSSLFDGSTEGYGWATSGQTVSGTSAASESEVHIILGTPCFITMAGYSWQARDDLNCCVEQTPSAMNVSGANSTDGPWTVLQSFSGVTDWTLTETKSWPAEIRAGPFRFFRFTVRRTSYSNLDHTSGDQAFLYAASVTELDECAAGVHNCDKFADCANTNGSFTCNGSFSCTCHSSLVGDGVACGFQIPPADIGRGDNLEFTWNKDTTNLYNGRVTMWKNYTGDDCPGVYRVYSANEWHVNPAGIQAAVGANEHNPATFFDSSWEGWPWATVEHLAGLNDMTASDVQVFLEVPCVVTAAGFAIGNREEPTWPDQNPSAFDVSGANSTSGPWTTLASISGVTNWGLGELKTWPMDVIAPFTCFRFTFKKVQGTVAGVVAADLAYILQRPAQSGTDKCSLAQHNCHSLATCTDSWDSFTCACNDGLAGDGVAACGVRIPPADIGSGNHLSFTWTLDDRVLHNGVLTVFKEYNGTVCPGEFRAYSDTWWGYRGNTTIGLECPPSSFFDGDTSGLPWHTFNGFQVAGANSAFESEVHVILGTPCHIVLDGYSWQARTDCCPDHSHSAMNVSGANSTEGPWTTLHSFSGATDWALGSWKTWKADVRAGPFRFFRFTIRRVQYSSTTAAAGQEAILYAAALTEVDECAAGTHNCDPDATCTNTNGSFTCACNSGLGGDGVLCGIQIPPSDIGRGDKDDFTWAKDDRLLHNGQLTIFKDYTGDVCPGEFRVFADSWWDNTGNSSIGATEHLPSSLFDGSTLGAPWASSAGSIANLLEANDSAHQVMLRLPCYITLEGYSWQSRADAHEYQNPSAMNVSGANSTDGPWTTLHSYSGGTNAIWDLGETKTWTVDTVTGPFRLFRFTFMRTSANTNGTGPVSGERTTLYAATVQELDECAAGVHNCDPQATCVNTNGSFTCTCSSGLDGDGVACGLRVPPADIGRGDNQVFTWSKDDTNLFQGFPTLHTSYGGAVCPGDFRVFSSHDWGNNVGNASVVHNEFLPSSLFDSTPAAYPWATKSSDGASLSAVSESAIHLILGTPCYMTLSGYAFQARDDCCEWQAPAAMNLSAANSTEGPWTVLNSFTGVTNWDVGEMKTWPVDVASQSLGPFRFFRFTIRRVNFDVSGNAAGDQAVLYATAWGELDECQAGVHDCHVEANCTNTNGSFACECMRGYEGNGTVCTDTDECSNSTLNDCDFNATCSNNIGSFACACNSGWPGNGISGNCTDSDECALGTDDCHADATCSNVLGSFLCACKSGFNGTGVSCADLAECQTGTHDCHLGAACTETHGSFACHCNTGFNDTGVGIGLPNGTACANSDECQANLDNCHSLATCNNAYGSFSCSCPLGYGTSDSGVTCLDEDECTGSSTGHSCDIQASCTNTEGSFYCTCNTGFGGSGVFCIESLQVPCGTSTAFQRTVVNGVPPDVCLFEKDTQAAVLRLNVPSPYLVGVQSLPNKTFEASTCNAVTTQDTGISVSNLANDTCRCNDDYLEKGSQTVSCTGVNGADPPEALWQDDSGTSGCAAVACSGEVPEAPIYGTMNPASPPNGDGWVTGDSVTFSCPEPLELYGDTGKTCSAVPLKKESRWNDYSIRPVYKDVTPPEFDCPDFTTQTDPSSAAVQISSYTSASYTDPGGIVTVLNSPAVPRQFPAGSTEVTITATDTEGNTGFCTFNINMEDKEAPTILCPPDIDRKQVLLDPLTVEFPVAPIAFDNVDVASKVSVSYSTPSGSPFLPGQSIVTVTATDTSGNAGACSFVVRVEPCPYGSQRVSETAPCICRAGFWQDLRGISFEARRTIDRTKVYPVCQDCLQNSRSPQDSTHPSACACMEKFYFVPADNTEERPASTEDYSYWTSGKCTPCPSFTTCPGTLFGKEKELREDGALVTTTTTTTTTGATTRRLQAGEEYVGISERIYESGQHSRPVPESGYVLAQEFPTVVVVECPLGETCEETVFSESEDGSAEKNVTCAEGMRGVGVLLNFLSLLGFIGLVGVSGAEMPEGLPDFNELIPGIPSINGVLSTDCILEPLLLAAGRSAQRRRRRLQQERRIDTGDQEDDAVLAWGDAQEGPLVFSSVFAQGGEEGGKAGLQGSKSQRSFRSLWGDASHQQTKEDRDREREVQRARGEREREQEARIRAAGLSEAQQRQLIRLEVWRRWNKRVLGIWRYDFPVPPPAPQPKGVRNFRCLMKCLMEDMVAVYIVLFFLTFEGSLEELLGVLRCEPLADGLESRLESAPSVSCTSDIYVRWSGIAAAVMVLLGVVMPLLLGVALMSELRKLRLESNRPLRANFRRRFGFLIQGFRTSREFWELTIIIRKLLLQLCLAFYFGPSVGENSNMWLSQAAWIAVASFVVQSREHPFNSQDNDILNSLESQALGTWLLSLVLFQMLALGSMTPLQNLGVVSAVLGLNFLFLLRIAGVIVTGYVTDVSTLVREVEDADDKSTVLPDAVVRVPFLWVLPVLKRLLRPLERLIDRAVSKDTLKLVDSGEAQGASDSGGALTEASLCLSSFVLARCSKVFEEIRPCSKEELEGTLREIDSVVSHILIKWDTELASDRQKAVSSLCATPRAPPSFHNLMAVDKGMSSFKSTKRVGVGQKTNERHDPSAKPPRDPSERWRRFRPPEFFDEFLFRWAVVCSQRLAEDEELAASAEGVNDLDELLWIAQRLLRPPVNAKDDHPFCRNLAEEENEEGDRRPPATARARRLSLLRERRNSAPTSETQEKEGEKERTTQMARRRRAAFDIVGERWDPLVRDSLMVQASSWAESSPEGRKSKSNNGVWPGSTKTGKGKVKGDGTGGGSTRGAGRAGEFRIDMQGSDLKGAGQKGGLGKGKDLEAPRRGSSFSALDSAEGAATAVSSPSKSASFFRPFISKRVTSFGGRRRGEGENSSSLSFSFSFSPFSEGRVFGCPVPERLQRSGFPLKPSQLKKVGEAFFSFGQNAVLLDSTADLDEVLRALRTFLQMHPTVVLWHYLCFMGAKRRILDQAAMAVIARWVRYVRDRVARAAVDPPIPALHDRLLLSEPQKDTKDEQKEAEKGDGSKGSSSSVSLGSKLSDMQLDVFRSAVHNALTVARDKAKEKGVRPNYRFVEAVRSPRKGRERKEEDSVDPLCDFAFVELPLCDHFGVTHLGGKYDPEFAVDSLHGTALECWLPLAPGPALKEDILEEGLMRKLFGEEEPEEEEEQEEGVRSEGSLSSGEPWLERALPAAFAAEDEEGVYSVNLSNGDGVPAAPGRRRESSGDVIEASSESESVSASGDPSEGTDSEEGKEKEEEEGEEDEDDDEEEEEEEEDRDDEEEDEEDAEAVPALSAMDLYEGVALGTRSRLNTFRSHAEGSSRPFGLREETERVKRGETKADLVKDDSSDKEPRGSPAGPPRTDVDKELDDLRNRHEDSDFSSDC
uniref:EGF-like domain-containing protein n=1 Tax=Chromera velia CCMP2878 TaxID=1169474 RepID=A0A0G4I514_9ALVE|eukprot:Cvel_11057.t1-p1 / transcript=Cvel_11057.t1 / gene=Cvel_11057 / organism=Chromera_velia_CCMP2878 / gene_product=Fibrillin-2, putative / transcript_product=Fibrillin-2, putative / location=Cvel_scaffold682:4037-37683(-) / protein_length=4195 / sequence_SO=supercontig / SO=protein_coding / is_pseudo=false